LHFAFCIAVFRIALGDAAKHHPVLAELLRERTRIDAGDARNFMVLQPMMKRTHRLEVAEIFAHLRDDHAAHMHRFALEVLRESPLVHFRARHAVIADEGVREDEDLSAVAWVRETLHVPRHPRIEDDFSVSVDLGAERFSGEDGAVGESEHCHVGGSVQKEGPSGDPPPEPCHFD